MFSALSNLIHINSFVNCHIIYWRSSKSISTKKICTKDMLNVSLLLPKKLILLFIGYPAFHLNQSNETEVVT